jgi:hypothetical protein
VLAVGRGVNVVAISGEPGSLEGAIDTDATIPKISPSPSAASRNLCTYAALFSQIRELMHKGQIVHPSAIPSTFRLQL